MDTRLAQSTMPSEARWQQIDQLLAAVAALVHSNLGEDEFARQVLSKIVPVLPCAVAGYWRVDRGVQMTLIALVRRPDLTSADAVVANAPRQQVLHGVLRTGAAAVLEAPWPETGAAHQVASPEHGALLASPVKSDDLCVGILELIQEEDQDSADRQWTLDVLGSVAELCADNFRRRRLAWLADREMQWRCLRQFSLDVHRSLDVSETAFTIVNDGRGLIDCDRVTLLSCDGGRCRTLAVSGAVTWDPRSDVVSRLEQLATAVSGLRTPIVFPALAQDSLESQPRARGDAPEDGGVLRSSASAGQSGLSPGTTANDLPPEVRDPLLAFLDSSGAKSVAALPLIAAGAVASGPAGAPAGVLVVEQFSTRIDESRYERLGLVAEHAAPALQNARRYRRAPWMAVVGEQRWRRLTDGRSRLRLWLYSAAAVVALAWIIPAPYEIEARGELQPRVRSEIFATDDAVVEELKVDHGDRVEAGQVLAILRNPQLDLEQKRISGELQTTHERLAAVQAARVELAVESAGRPAGAARLSGEEAGLRAQLGSLERQSKLLDEQQDSLTVRSPITGKVMTWDLPQLLQSRPVQRGQILMTVADPDGAWVLELHVPERRVGTLNRAQQGGEFRLPVTFVLATESGRKHAATIDQVASSVEPSSGDEASVLVTVAMNREELVDPRPGAGAVGHISCGLRPLAYVWLHDLIDTVWGWVWF
jgi:GAF domain-containing protein